MVQRRVCIKKHVKACIQGERRHVTPVASRSLLTDAVCGWRSANAEQPKVDIKRRGYLKSEGADAAGRWPSPQARPAAGHPRGRCITNASSLHVRVHGPEVQHRCQFSIAECCHSCSQTHKPRGRLAMARLRLARHQSQPLKRPFAMVQRVRPQSGQPSSNLNGVTEWRAGAVHAETCREHRPCAGDLIACPVIALPLARDSMSAGNNMT